MLTPKLTYDAAEHVVSVETSGVSLETKKDIRTFFDACRRFWREHCGGEKAYWIVGYDGFSVNLRENDYYAGQLSLTVKECVVVVVRYGGDNIQRSGARLRGLKLHSPSMLYETRDEALEVVRAIRAGTVSVSDDGP